MRDPAIDYLRGISIVLVVTMHYCYFFFGGPRFGLSAEEFSVFYRNGAYGVTIFFVLSGFLITLTSIQRFGTLKAVSPKRFYLLRAGRIFPPLILLLAVLLVLHASGVRFATVDSPHRLGTLLSYIITNRANWYLLTHGSIGLPWDVLWSLAVEEMFYLFFPLVVVLVPGRALPWISAGLIGLGPPYRATHVLFDYFSCTDQLAIGCLVAYLVGSGHASRLSKWLKAAAIVTGVGAIGAMYLGKSMDNDNRVWGPTAVALGAALLIISTRPNPDRADANMDATSGVKRWFTFGWLFQSLGRSSYELYLFHGVLMVLFVPAFPFVQRLLARAGIDAPNLGFAVVYTAVLVAVGYLLRRFYSEPLNRWVRRRCDARRANRAHQREIVQAAAD